MDDYGSVDLFGLDEFGNPQGMDQKYGAALGAAFQTVTAIAVRKYTNYKKYSEGIGVLAGAVAGGSMIAFTESKAAGWTALISSVVSGGIRQLAQLTDMDPGFDGGLGIHTYETVPTLGYATVERQSLVPGSSGLSGDFAGPVQLQAAGDYGMSNNPAARQVQLVGGPEVSGLSAHFGSTIFG